MEFFTPFSAKGPVTERDTDSAGVNLEDLHAFNVISGFAGSRSWIRIDLLFFRAPTAELSSALHSCYPAYVGIIIL